MANAAPYKIITDPEKIKQKNALRKAVSEEYIKNTSNPFRNVKMEGGTLVCKHRELFNLLNGNGLQLDAVHFYSSMLVFKDICP